MPQRAEKFNKAQQALCNCLRSNVLKINDLREASAVPLGADELSVEVHLVESKEKTELTYSRQNPTQPELFGGRETIKSHFVRQVTESKDENRNLFFEATQGAHLSAGQVLITQK
jgi:hypothetical protein